MPRVIKEPPGNSNPTWRLINGAPVFFVPLTGVTGWRFVARLGAMRVAILDDYQNVALGLADWSPVEEKASIQVFTDHLSDAHLIVERLRDFQIIVAMRERTPFPRALFEKLPNLQLLAITGMGTRAFDLRAATERGVTVCGTKGEIYGAIESELAWGLILALARDITGGDRAMRQGGWVSRIGVMLHGKRLGIIGLGRIGARVAGFGRAFGMDVVAWSQNLTAERCREVGVDYVGLEELLGTADVISIHLVLGDRTRGLIGRRQLGLMKPTALLVNISRGPIIDEDALIEALAAGSIGGAGLDVFDTEPLPPDHALRRADRCVLTPHVGYVADSSYAGFYAQCAENVRAYLDGKPQGVLNPEVLDKD